MLFNPVIYEREIGISKRRVVDMCDSEPSTLGQNLGPVEAVSRQDAEHSVKSYIRERLKEHLATNEQIVESGDAIAHVNYYQGEWLITIYEVRL